MAQTYVETKVGFVMNKNMLEDDTAYQFGILRVLSYRNDSVYFCDNQIQELVDQKYIILVRLMTKCNVGGFDKYEMSITLKGLWLLFLHRKGLI
jgi:hypothetical protein